MARIAYFTDEIDAQGSLIGRANFNFVWRLAETQNEVLVLTTPQDQALWPQNKNIQYLQPFRRWNILESLRLAAPLYRFRPNIYHFSQPLVHQKAASNFTQIAAIAKANNEAIVATTLYDVERNKNKSSLDSLLGLSDAVAIFNKHHKNIVTSNSKVSSQCQVEVIPAAMEYPLSDTPPWPADTMKSWVYVPGPVSEHRDILELIAKIKTNQPTVFLFVDGWGSGGSLLRRKFRHRLAELGLTEKVLVCDDLSEEEKNWLAQKSLFFLVCSLPPIFRQLTFELDRALYLQKPVVLTQLQQSLHHFHWLDETHCRLASEYLFTRANDISVLINDSELRMNLEANIKKAPGTRLLDQANNAMNRLYQRVYEA